MITRSSLGWVFAFAGFLAMVGGAYADPPAFDGGPHAGDSIVSLSSEGTVEDVTYDDRASNGRAFTADMGAGPSAAELAGALGACCDGDSGWCESDVDQSECMGANDTFSLGEDCCSAACSGPGEFASFGVTLLKQVPIESFPGAPHLGSDVWGYVSPSGGEYALMGFSTGVGIVDITLPFRPVHLNFISGAGIDTVWRDIAVYDEFAYIVTDGGGVGLQIVDLRNIDAGQAFLINTTDLGVGFVDAHNVFVNEESGYLYLAIANLNSGNGLMVVDLKPDPINPTGATFWTDPSAGVRCHDVQVVSYLSGPFAGREIAFCFAEGRGVRIADVTDKSSNASMFTMSQLVYPNTSYTHQGWLSADKQHLFIGDELDERDDPDVTQTTTYIADVSDLNNPTLVGTFGSGLCSIDHNLMTRGNCVYEANYASGLRVFDTSDINNVREVAFFDTRPEDNAINFNGAWGVFTDFPSGVVIVSDRQRGLFVFEHDCTPSVGPIAQLTATPNPAACHDQITLDGSASSHADLGGSIVSWEWDFDYDGFSFDVEASGEAVQHTYDALGSFTAALRVTDGGNPPLTNLQEVLIDLTEGNTAPIAVAGGPYEALERTGFTLDAGQSTDPDSDCADAIQKYSWDLDNDGVNFEVTSSEPIVEVAASLIESLDLGAPDVPLTIRLRVEDVVGATSDTTASFTVLGDCNFNGIHDAQEIASQQVDDADTNGVPDECEVLPPVMAPPPHDIRKNRFISFDPGNPVAPVAFRLSLLDLACSVTGKRCSAAQDCKVCIGGTQTGNACSIGSNCPGGTCEVTGETCVQQGPPVLLGWVDTPEQADGDAPPDTSTATVVDVQPDFRVWAEPTVHIGDCEISPVHTYGLTAVSAVMESEMLVLGTIDKPEGKFWADIVGSFTGTAWTAPNGLVNVDDVAGLLNFITLKPAPHITVVDLAGAGPDFVNFIINSTDLALLLQAFQGKAYPPPPFTAEGYPIDGDVTQCPQ